MANLVRSAKSGKYWTLNDLDSYHISLTQMEPLMFFGLQALPQPSVDKDLLTIADADAMLQDRHVELMYLLDLAMISQKGETAVVDFVVTLFNVLGYVPLDRLARRRVNLPLFICGEARNERTDTCIVDCSQGDILLLVQEDKLGKGALKNADAIGLPPLVEKVMPGIVMRGMSPIFFKIPVTQTLVTHINHGIYPSEETRVTYCYPPVPRPAHQQSEGMKPLDNRREILKCYEAFKAIVDI